MRSRPRSQRSPVAFRGAVIGAIVVLAAVAPAGTVRAQIAAADSAVIADSTAVADTAAVPLRDIGDLLGQLVGRKVPTERVTQPRPGLSVTILPSIGYNPSYGAFFGASVALGAWLGDPKTTHLSAASIGASYSTTEQVSVQFKSDFYLPRNEWALKGDWRYLDTSQPTFGLGAASEHESEYPMSFVLYRLYQALYHRVSSSPIFVGVGYHFDRYDDIHDTRAEAGELTPFSIYSRGTPERTQSSAVSANVLIDTRDNPINAASGMYWNASLRAYGRVIGSDQDRQSLWRDFRSSTRLPKDGRNVLAIWTFLWMTFGKAPYLDLPAIGWDTYGRSGRGYLQGRIRGADMVYVEAEYRARFTRNDMRGGVAFVN